MLEFTPVYTDLGREHNDDDFHPIEDHHGLVTPTLLHFAPLCWTRRPVLICVHGWFLISGRSTFTSESNDESG